MQYTLEIIDGAISDIEKLRKVINIKKIDKVNSIDEKNLIKATSYAWIKSYKSKMSLLDVSSINDLYCELLNYSDQRTKRITYKKLITQIKNSLIKFRSAVVKNPEYSKITNTNSISMPNFSILISDLDMIQIMKKRWIEIENCLMNEAPLASTVMMGGLLESVLMTKINTLDDKTILFKQKSTPIDNKTHKPKQLSEWMLKDYIDVLNEVKIITKPTAEFSRLIRDYRNYIHPEKELRMGESITVDDAKLFWIAVTNLITQILS